MSRRHRAEKREINPDAKYGDIVLTKFMNSLMLHGKKSIAEKTLYAALDQVESKISRNPVEVFHEALENVMPAVEVRSRRVGGATYQVPVEVRSDRKAALAIRWLIAAARARGENTMVDRLAGEFLDAVNNRGNAVKKREDTHRMAEASAIRCVSSRFFTALPRLFTASRNSPAKRSTMVFSPRARAAAINQRIASAALRSERTSTGT